MKSCKFYLFSAILFYIVPVPILSQTPTPTPETITVNTTSENVKNADDIIHLGDLIDVDVIGSVEYDWRGTLNPEGFLNGIDFVENPIFALCRSEEEVAEEVAKGYSKILRAPQVAVKILDRSKRPLSILYGAIKTPQRFQIKRPFFLNELIITAGGLTERASGTIQILRQKNLNCSLPKNHPNTLGSGEDREKFVTASQESNGSTYINIRISDLLSGKKEANPQILSGDIVTVLEAEAIYVIGGVGSPKQISSRTKTTLSRAIAAAGGIAKNGDAKKITIYRRSAGETKIIEADLDKIKAGEAEDLALQTFDIVEVEQSGGGKRQFAPVLRIAEADEKKPLNLPLRIID